MTAVDGQGQGMEPVKAGDMVRVYTPWGERTHCFTAVLPATVEECHNIDSVHEEEESQSGA
jgi:hypothetical protein